MLHLLEAHGIRVFSLTSGCRHVDAFSLVRDGTPFMFIDTSKSGERQRFDGAHELGHLVLHSETQVVRGRDREREANQFAAALLMPMRGVISQALREASLQRLIAAKSYWKVAAIAMAHRLHELAILSDWTYRSTCIGLAKMGFRGEEPGGIAPETSQILAKVLRLLRHEGETLAAVAVEIGLTEAEISRHIFGLAPTGIPGGGKMTPGRAQLELVR